MMTTANKLRCFVLLLVALIVPTIAHAAPDTEIKSDGTIVVGNSTRILLGLGGVINVARDNGDKYEAFIPITRSADGKSFHLYQLDDRKITVDSERKIVTWRGVIPAAGGSPAIPVEISATAMDGGKVRIAVRYLADRPVQELLSSRYLQFQSPRSQHAGHEMTVDGRSAALATDAPSAAGGRSIHLGSGLPETVFFPGDADRRLSIAPVEAASLEIYDNNLPPSPTVFFRFHPKGNAITFDLGFSGENRAASPETYFGVDYLAANKIRLPRYSVSRNLVQNPGFEAGFHSWQRSRRGRMTESRIDEHYLIEADGAFAGRRSLKIRGEKAQGPAALSTFAIPVEAGATYTLSFYARADRPGVPIKFSSITLVWPVFVDKTFSLTTEWKRYDYTFKMPNDMLNVGFSIENPGDDCVAWVDNVQLEKGTLTDFTDRPVGAHLVTDGRGNWLEPGAKVNARLELYGIPRRTGSAEIRITDFFGRTVRQETRPFTLGADGAAALPLAWAEKLAPGLYVVETDIASEEFSGRDFSRLMILPFADNTAPHKNMFAFGAEDWNMGMWKRRLDFFKRAGIGSAVQFDPPPHAFLEAMGQAGITDVSSIFEHGHFAAGKHLKESFHLTDAELKVVEEEAYAKAKAWPQIRYWKTVNEPGDRMAVNVAEMKEFVKTQIAAYRGIKRANPNAVVLSPDPANMAPQSGIQWLDLFLEAGGKAACDAIAIHPYRPRPEEPDMDADVATLLRMLDRHGYRGDIWFTEGMGNFFMHLPAWGVDVHKALSQEGPSVGWRVGTLTYDLGYGERTAAAYAMRSWLVALKYGDRVKQFVNWYYFMNSTVDYDLTPGAEVFASNTLTRLLGDSRFQQDIELGEGLRGYLFEDGAKRPVAALWSLDIRVDKGELPGSTLDVSSLPADAELFDIAGDRLPRTAEIHLSSFPVFVRGAAGSTAALAKTLAQLPLSASTGRQLVPFVKMTGGDKGEVRLQNLLSRPAQGRLQVTQDGKELLRADITVAGKATWSAPIRMQATPGKLTPQKVRVAFQPSGAGPAQVSDLSLETLAISRVATPPTMDGDLADWPRATALPIPRRIVSWGKVPAHSGPADLSGTFYSAWDDDHLYLAFDVKDESFAPAPRTSPAWQGDSIQIYFDSFQNALAATKPSFDTDDQNFDLHPGPDGVTVRRVITPDVQLAFLKPGIVETARTGFKRTADGYVVELAIPKRDLAPIVFKAGSSFGFSFIVSDKDDEASGRKRGLTLTPEGTEPFNHPELFTVVTLDPAVAQ